MSQVVALAVADIHLRHSCPPARAAESDWYKAMLRPIEQLRALVAEYKCPVICAGDIFDRWDSPPELINFAIKYLPKMIAIPGQHDLPNHEYGSKHRSAYRTLELAGILWGGDTGRLLLSREVSVDKFPWGTSVKSNGFKGDTLINIALIHSLIWKKGHTYPDAPETSNIKAWMDRLDGYNVAVFGDNHDGFIDTSKGCRIMNCGCLIRAKSNERDYKPSVGLIYDDGSITRKHLDTSEDKWIDPEPKKVDSEVAELKDFLQELHTLGVSKLDFRTAVERYLEKNKVRESVIKILIDSMEGE